MFGPQLLPNEPILMFPGCTCWRGYSSGDNMWVNGKSVELVLAVQVQGFHTAAIS